MREEGRLLGPQAHAAEQFGDPGVALIGLAHVHQVHGLAHNGPGAHAWIERRVGVLEHDLDLAAHPAQCIAPKGRHLNAVQPDRSAGDGHQPHGGKRGSRLAGAALADNAEGRAAAHIVGDAVHGMHRAAGRQHVAARQAEMDLEVPDLEKVVGAAGRSVAPGHAVPASS